MRSTSRAALALAATASLATTTALAAPTAAGEGTGTPTGVVFRVNPVQSSGDQTLTDQKDSASAVPAEEYAEVPLTDLDGSGLLSGTWAVVESSTGKPASSDAGRFAYDRSDDRFEQVMAYFWATQAQNYLQSLGFGSALPGVMDEQLAIKVNQYGGDNSFHTDKPFRIRLGKGGVDDAEDGEVVVHEYGHAIHADQVPGFGASLDARTIGEAFGDYFAVSVGLDAAAQYAWNVRAETDAERARGWEAAACFADWDATSISQSTTAKCLRRLDQAFTVADRVGDIYFDSMVWSGALWRIRQDYEGLGLGARAWDTSLVLAQFDFAPDTSFDAAAQDIHRTVLARDGQAAADAVASRFADRGVSVS